MNDEQLLECPNCKGHNFLIKYEATYVYSYNIDSDAPGFKNTGEFLPFMFDKREQKDAHQYLECKTCGNQYPCYLNEWDNKTGILKLQKAVGQPTKNIG
ncbi:hypothetical protein [Ruminiclostridium cellobioparum]|jgi:uncharacterized protein YbaR (Trm112 family)|uniref:Uncharacterized protein n=1 Tax=Ruminiclostridium cellobioparum subsp. termitidis CT1112 TaxID=1195236 RepID=S0FJP7_RUMCE|nr:hypothetical protein [Ruminiclostridium cellobioparum]EMS72012.1 hypothetical protein CTER_2077 [Ruminiclostridium cellobioparum subsp. termitidis CT1112]